MTTSTVRTHKNKLGNINVDTRDVHVHVDCTRVHDWLYNKRSTIMYMYMYMVVSKQNDLSTQPVQMSIVWFTVPPNGD